MNKTLKNGLKIYLSSAGITFPWTMYHYYPTYKNREIGDWERMDQIFTTIICAGFALGWPIYWCYDKKLRGPAD